MVQFWVLSWLFSLKLIQGCFSQSRDVQELKINEGIVSESHNRGLIDIVTTHPIRIELQFDSKPTFLTFRI